jgi:hypothetical protein
MAKETKNPQAVLTEACYAALGAGDAAFACVRKLSEQLPDRLRAARERFPDTLAELADRGRRLTGQVSARNGENAKTSQPTEPAQPASTEHVEQRSPSEDEDW